MTTGLLRNQPAAGQRKHRRPHCAASCGPATTVAAQHIISQTYPPVTGAIAKLLAAGAADGSFRSGLDPADVLILMGFLWRVPDTGEGREMAARMFDVVLAGLRP